MGLAGPGMTGLTGGMNGAGGLGTGGFGDDRLIEQMASQSDKRFRRKMRAAFFPVNYVVTAGCLAGVLFWALPVIFWTVYGALLVFIDLASGSPAYYIDSIVAHYSVLAINYITRYWWLGLMIIPAGGLLGWFRRHCGNTGKVFRLRSYRWDSNTFVEVGYDFLAVTIIAFVVLLFYSLKGSIASIFFVGSAAGPLLAISVGPLIYTVWELFQDLFLVILGLRHRDRNTEYVLKEWLLKSEQLYKWAHRLSINVDRDNGKVILQGEVSNELARLNLIDLAQRLSGLQHVDTENLRITAGK